LQELAEVELDSPRNIHLSVITEASQPNPVSPGLVDTRLTLPATPGEKPFSLRPLDRTQITLGRELRRHRFVGPTQRLRQSLGSRRPHPPSSASGRQAVFVGELIAPISTTVMSLPVCAGLACAKDWSSVPVAPAPWSALIPVATAATSPARAARCSDSVMLSWKQNERPRSGQFRQNHSH
jgi:hypothetical protein